MNETYWLHGIIAHPSFGQTPVIFHVEALEVNVVDGKFTVLDERFAMINNLLRGMALTCVDQYYTTTNPENGGLFYTFLSRDKSKVDVAINSSELILRLIGLELANEQAN